MTKDIGLYQKECCCQLKPRIYILYSSTDEFSNYKIRLGFGISVWDYLPSLLLGAIQPPIQEHIRYWLAPRTSVTLFNGDIYLLVIVKVTTRASRQEKGARCLKPGTSFPLLSIDLLGTLHVGENMKSQEQNFFKSKFFWIFEDSENMES